MNEATASAASWADRGLPPGIAERGLADDLDRAVIALSRQDFTTSTTLTGR